MGKTLAKSLALAVVAPALVIGLGGNPSQAHNDWGLPLVGGLVGGYGLSTLINRNRERDRSQGVQPTGADICGAGADICRAGGGAVRRVNGS